MPVGVAMRELCDGSILCIVWGMVVTWVNAHIETPSTLKTCIIFKILPLCDFMKKKDTEKEQ